jgi:hypothetical protein
MSIRFVTPGLSGARTMSLPESVTARLNFFSIAAGSSSTYTVPSTDALDVDIFRDGSWRSMIRAPTSGIRCCAAQLREQETHGLQLSRGDDPLLPRGVAPEGMAFVEAPAAPAGIARTVLFPAFHSDYVFANRAAVGQQVGKVAVQSVAKHILHGVIPQAFQHSAC